MKNKDKSNILRVIIIVLMVVIIGLLALLFSGGVEINKKTNYTINCSDDLIYLFLKEAFVDIGIITNSISNSIFGTCK